MTLARRMSVNGPRGTVHEFGLRQDRDAQFAKDGCSLMDKIDKWSIVCLPNRSDSDCTLKSAIIVAVAIPVVLFIAYTGRNL
jgi:hypothetical protein